jgi:cytosine/adenosine deaminase-related metal-dependent hydrolase
MIRHLSADFIVPIHGDPLKDGVVSVNQRGEIVNLTDRATAGFEVIEVFEGVIVPGFVNSHCHLELSHMKGRISGGEGLISFIKEVMGKRAFDDQAIIESMQQADRNMYDKGIVAVGDISNNLLSKEVKMNSRIHYHTFVEFMGFDPARAASVFSKAIDLLTNFSPLSASLAPHAPYSVSKDLFKLLQKNTNGRHEITSIHNQESEDENELYRYKTGNFLDFYKQLNLNIDFFKAQARDSIQSIVPLFSPEQRVLMVHNTYTSLKDLHFADRFNRDIHWCFCPKANLYIEGNLPKIDMFSTRDFNITVGTDSLASNDELCILSELKIIKKYFPSLSFLEILPWASINGARFLGIDHKYGSIEIGKIPGLNLITHMDGLEMTVPSKLKRIV